jgi:hypothetical protein
MIKATSRDGTHRRVVYNESVVLVDDTDKLIFNIIDEEIKVEVIINFTFSNEGKKFKTEGHLSSDGKTLDIILHKWDGSFPIENTDPIIMTITLTRKRLWIKFRTIASKEKSFRTFQLTVWTEE